MRTDKLELQALRLAEKALHLYFVTHDNEALLQLFSQRTSSWIGWAEHEDYLSYKDVYNTFTARIGEIPQIEISEIRSRILLSLPNMYVVYLTCRFDSSVESGTALHEHAKYTFFIGCEDEQLKIWHLHSSASWKKLRSGEFFPYDHSRTQLLEEERQLEQSRLAASLAINTPNGLKCCKVDRDYPAVFINKALYTLAGYSSMNEMLLATNGSLSKTIYSADLPKVKKILAAHTDGSIYSINYRLLRREGSPIWVLERGQYYTDPSGTDYFICSIAPLSAEQNNGLYYGSLIDTNELNNPQVPLELWFKTALEIASSKQETADAICKLLKLTTNILHLPGAFISSLGKNDEPVTIAYSYYDDGVTPQSVVLPYTPNNILPSFNSSNITQCSDVRIMPKEYYVMVKSINVSAFYSRLITIDSSEERRQYVLNFYQHRPHHWTENEKELIEQLARLCTLLLR